MTANTSIQLKDVSEQKPFLVFLIWEAFSITGIIKGISNVDIRNVNKIN